MRKPSLRVLLFAIALIASAAVLAQQTGQIVMQPDTKQPVKIVITNHCKSPQTFDIKESPPLSWISFTSGNSANVSPGAPGSFVVTIQTNGMKPGEYKATLSVTCASCAESVPPCLQDKKDFPLDVVIPGPDNSNSNGGGAGGAEGGSATGGKPPLPPPSNPPTNVPPAGPSRTGGSNGGTPTGTPSASAPQGGTPPANTPAAGKPAGANPPTGSSSNSPATALPKTPPATTPQATTPTTPPMTPPATSTGTEQAQVMTDNGGAGSNVTDQIPTSSPENPLTTAVQLGGILLAGAAAGLLAGSGKLATATTTPVATTPTPSKPVADTPVVPAQTPTTPPQSPGSWGATMQTAMQDVAPHSSSGGGTPVTDVVPKQPTTPAQQAPGYWDAAMQTPVQDVVPHSSSGGGTPVTDAGPKLPTTPAQQAPGSWDATMQTPVQDVVPHSSSGGGTPVTDVGPKLPTTPAQQAPWYWDAAMQTPLQDAVARASTGGAAISDNSVPSPLLSSTIGTEYIDPENGNVRLIPNGWVKLQPGPDDPWPGPSPFSSFPVGHEPRIFVNPQTGEQKWVVVDLDNPPPPGWIRKDIGTPLVQGEGTQYIDPDTGQVHLVPNGWVKLQPVPDDPSLGPSPFSSFPPGQAPRIFVNPQTGEQQWFAYNEKPPQGWVSKGPLSSGGLGQPQMPALPGQGNPRDGGSGPSKPASGTGGQGGALHSQTDTPDGGLQPAPASRGPRGPAQVPKEGANVIASDQMPPAPANPQQAAVPAPPAARPPGPAAAQAAQPVAPDTLPHTVEKPGTGSTDAVPTSDHGESKLQTDEHGNVKNSPEGTAGLAQVREDVAIVDHLAYGKFPVSLDRDGNPVIAPPPAPPAPPKPLTAEDQARLNFIDNQIAEAHNAGDQKREKVWTEIKANYPNLAQAFLSDLDDLRQLTDLRDQAIRDGAGPTLVDAYMRVLGHINEKLPVIRHLGHAFLGLSDREIDTYGLIAELTRSVEEHQHIIALWFSKGGSNAVDEYGRDEAEKSLIAGGAGIVAGGASAGVSATQGAITSGTGVKFDSPFDYIDNRPKPPGTGAGVSEPVTSEGVSSTQPESAVNPRNAGGGTSRPGTTVTSDTSVPGGVRGATVTDDSSVAPGRASTPQGSNEPVGVGAPNSGKAYASAGTGKGGGGGEGVRGGGAAGDTPLEGGGKGDSTAPEPGGLGEAPDPDPSDAAMKKLIKDAADAVDKAAARPARTGKTQQSTTPEEANKNAAVSSDAEASAAAKTVQLDQAAQKQIGTIPDGRGRAYVYDPVSDRIAAGDTIHEVLADQIESSKTNTSAGFLKRSKSGSIQIGPSDSPHNLAGTDPVILAKVKAKLRALGFSVE